jgi:hypothetical protein
MSDRLKIGAGLLAVGAAVVLFVVLQSGNSDSSNETSTNAGSAVPVIHLKRGEPAGGIQDLEVTAGDPVKFRVTSDIAGEVHVHGYDYEKPIDAGGSVSFDFPAKLEGVFEIELHHGGGENEIAGLKVEPG